MEKRGRPNGSAIRQNIVEILASLGKAYGYEIYKRYCEIYPNATMRVIYYHLKKGVAIGEFEVESIRQEAGDYSWGGSAEKIYYRLGPQAKPKGDPKALRHFEAKR